MGKLTTFYRYGLDFIRNGEFHYFVSSIKFMLTGKPTRKSGLYKSNLGTFYVRKGTLDFQFANYAYEWNVKKFVYNYIKDYNKFVDIGANIGTYTILFCKAGLQGCAFEPVSSNFEALKKNVELNNFTEKVKLYKMGLGAFEHDDEFEFDPINTGATHLSSIDHPDSHEGKKEKATIVPFDNIVEKCGFDKKNDKVFIKIDVEGMELNVLNGAHNFLKTFPEIILVIETVHSGREKIKNKLLEIDSNFKFIDVDDLNMGAVKTNKNKN